MLKQIPSFRQWKFKKKAKSCELWASTEIYLAIV